MADPTPKFENGSIHIQNKVVSKFAPSAKICSSDNDSQICNVDLDELENQK